MKPKDLAQALKRAVSEGLDVDSAVKNFITVLERRGMLNILPKVLLQLQHIQERENTHRPTLSVAAKEHFSSALKRVAIKEGEIVKNIDETLIGGYKFEQSGELTDASYKKQLIDLYRKIIK